MQGSGFPARAGSKLHDAGHDEGSRFRGIGGQSGKPAVQRAETAEADQRKAGETGDRRCGKHRLDSAEITDRPHAADHHVAEKHQRQQGGRHRHRHLAGGQQHHEPRQRRQLQSGEGDSKQHGDDGGKHHQEFRAVIGAQHLVERGKP